MSRLIDLRSDTVTKPTPDMLKFMINAPVGDDVYGEDPSVNRLEQVVAELFGFEAALFTPSGTMANQIAINCHTRPGDSILAEEDSHVFLYEAGAAAAQSGVQFDLLPLAENWADAAIQQRIKPDWLHYASTKLIVVENTHNRGSGRPIDREALDRIQHHAKQKNLATHCDGARIWNAAVALKCDEKVLAQGFDSLSVCFSKGLGAPVGSALLGAKTFIERAKKVRKRWGGGMRQAGYLAAACLFAMEHGRRRLEEDHHHLKMLYDGICNLVSEGLPVKAELPKIWTNILYFSTPKADFLVNNLKDQGILMTHLGNGKIRAVTHLEISEQDIPATLEALRKALTDAKSLVF